MDGASKLQVGDDESDKHSDTVLVFRDALCLVGPIRRLELRSTECI